MIGFLVLAGCASSEPPTLQPPEGGGPSAIEAQLYPAVLVMDHQAAIGLSTEQRERIEAELQAAQREIVSAEVQLRADREILSRALGRDPIDEAEAMRVGGQVAEGERAIKLIHLRLLVRIKNELTADQRRALDRLRH